MYLSAWMTSGSFSPSVFGFAPCFGTLCYWAIRLWLGCAALLIGILCGDRFCVWASIGRIGIFPRLGVALVSWLRISRFGIVVRCSRLSAFVCKRICVND